MIKNVDNCLGGGYVTGMHYREKNLAKYRGNVQLLVDTAYYTILPTPYSQNLTL